MRRSITLAGFALLAFCFARPVAAQQHAGNLAEEYAKEGKEQTSHKQKLASSRDTSAYMSSTRSSLGSSPFGANGRIDMSGRTPPSYFQLRSQSSNLSPWSSTSSRAARHAAPRSNYYSRYAKTAPRHVPVTPTNSRRFEAPIPPAPR